MHFSGVTLVLMLMSVSTTFVRVLSGETFNCNRYIDFAMKEYFCRPKGLFLTFDIDDGILTGEELLEEIQNGCSNQTAVQVYLSCVGELGAKCPVQFPLIVGNFEKKRGMFCDGTEVSSWLSTLLQSGLTYSKECENVSMPLITDCAKELSASYGDKWNDISLSAALDIMPSFISKLFQCTKTKFSATSVSFEECGSSWQDMLTGFWLRMLALAGFGVHLSGLDEVQLKELKFEENVPNFMPAI